LVKAGDEALLNKAMLDGTTCLHLDSQNGHLEVVMVLIQAGGEALLNRNRVKSFSCLHVASDKGHLEVVMELVKAGGEALLNKTCTRGCTCMHLASLKLSEWASTCPESAGQGRWWGAPEHNRRKWRLVSACSI
jgi:hypothetical protein